MIIYTNDYIRMRMKTDPKGWEKEINSVWKLTKYVVICFLIFVVSIIIYLILQ